MKQIACFLILFALSGCFRNNKQKGLVYYTDFEGVKGWTQTLFSKNPVHSGVYSNRLDSTHHFGLTLKLLFREISDKPVKKVKISFWAYLQDTTTKGKLVLEISDFHKQNLFWVAKHIEDYVSKPNAWTKVNLEFTLTKENISASDNIISIYPWNVSKSEIYIDDTRIEFVV